MGHISPQMRQAAQQVTFVGTPLGRQALPHGTRLHAWQRLSDDRRAAQLAMYENVEALRAQGETMKGTARELALH